MCFIKKKKIKLKKAKKGSISTVFPSFSSIWKRCAESIWWCVWHTDRSVGGGGGLAASVQWISEGMAGLHLVGERHWRLSCSPMLPALNWEAWRGTCLQSELRVKCVCECTSACVCVFVSFYTASFWWRSVEWQSVCICVYVLRGWDAHLLTLLYNSLLNMCLCVCV